MDIDSRDRAILRLLQINARRTHAEIGEQVGLSASACHRRIRMLEQAGHIRGYTVVLGRGGAGERRVNMLVQVTLERQTEDYLGRFERAVRACPEVKECFLIAGSFDYWLRVEAEDAASYELIHSEILSRLPGVTRINSSLAMRDALGQRRDGM
ncbi:Lrp/AsnC family transcriptional regulator [Sandaracinobacter sp. RS1-74]|uniref:Lrp/AsnC family transcriptional regulator n=1 Tax=Sandaracinobacteroides sayramensis TaxID=2913411 RepID=UPI001EDA41F0|nr:Lrp/AsnC family transcriptional regulator [Sandaracinobacteroides sayramensis]MCG2841376.1 Lrp/AsnC family transcriptional regulator [Sandaracinobacteroides sayramensis]